MKKNFGLSMIEIMLSIAILAIIATMGTTVYFGYIKSAGLNSAYSSVFSELKRARAKAMAGEGGYKWGLHLVNVAGDDYYEIFSTPTDYSDVGKVIDTKIYFSNGIYFSDPTETAGSKDIIFQKITGNLIEATSTQISSSYGQSKTINISASGNVY